MDIGIDANSVRIAGGFGGLNSPHLILSIPYLWSKFDPGFAEVGMLLDSHCLLIMQFLKYLHVQRDDLNVTTTCILIHIKD